jgi:hypothetical protein
MDENITKIRKMYDNLSYLDQYGNSVLMVILITIILLLIFSYSYILMNITPIKNNWVAERCKPYIIPFAGFINAPEGTSITDFTGKNFTYCMQNVTRSLAGNAISPLSFVTNSLTMVSKIIQSSINSIRQMVDKVRTNIQSVTQEVMGRIMNFIVPLQQIIIKVKDMLMKIQGVFTGILYTLFGSYYTLKSLLGSIANLVTKILISMAVSIAVLWLLPFTWGAAAAGTGVFAIIAAFMTYVLVFMKDVLHVQPGLKIPKLKCFDKNTLITMKDGSKKPIIDVCLGDILLNNIIVTAKFKVETNGSQMYQLNNVIVSDTHMVNHNNTFIRVSSHPLAQKVAFYNEEFLYCLNTNKKVIIINDNIFSDWDEVNNKEINVLKKEINNCYNLIDLNYLKYLNDFNDLNDFNNLNEDNDLIHKYIDSGFISSTIIKLQNGEEKQISQIKINDVLENGEKVYGLVEIDGKNLNDQYVYYLGSNICIEGGPNLVFYNNKGKLNTTLDLRLNNLHNNYKKTRSQNDDKLFHLLTNNKTFVINGIKFSDYNASVDIFL